MADDMLKFVDVRAGLSGQARRPSARAEDFREIADRYAVAEGRGAVGALLAMRRALLLGALPAAQPHPRLAAADRRGAAARGV